MPSGRDLPPGAIEQIEDLGRNWPETTEQQIADEVGRQFGLRIDRSTVSKRLKRLGLERTVRSKTRPQRSEEPSLAKERHWPAMWTMASRCAATSQVPYAQLMEIPWKGPDAWDLYDPRFRLQRDAQQCAITLDLEGDPVFEAIRQHLPEHPVWRAMDRWKESVANLSRALGPLPGRVQAAPAWKTMFDGYALGSHAAVIAAHAAVHRALGLSPSGEVAMFPPTKGTWPLEWLGVGAMVELARAESGERVDAWIATWPELLDTLANEVDELEIEDDLASAWNLWNEVQGHFHEISEYATFPDSCNLYSGS